MSERGWFENPETFDRVGALEYRLAILERRAATLEHLMEEIFSVMRPSPPAATQEKHLEEKPMPPHPVARTWNKVKKQWEKK